MLLFELFYFIYIIYLLFVVATLGSYLFESYTVFLDDFLI